MVLPGREASLVAHERAAAVEKSRQRFIQALKAIPNNEKEAYLEALERAPLLLQTETPMDRFIACDMYNMNQAALRLIAYWQLRKRLFGPDRAFLPMKQGGETTDYSAASAPGGSAATAAVSVAAASAGSAATVATALNENDREVLVSGHAHILPSLDQQGRVVLAMESSYTPPPVPDISSCRQRTLFYLLHVASETETAQEEGIVGLYIFGGLGHHSHVVDERSIAFGLEALGEGLPIRLHHLHAICLPPTTTHSSSSMLLDNFFDTVLPGIFRVAGEFHGHGPRCSIYIGRTVPEIKQTLVEHHDLVPSGLPTSVGGTVDRVHIHAWMKKQGTQEKERQKSQQQQPPPQQQQQQQQTFHIATPAMSLLSTALSVCSFPNRTDTTGRPISQAERDSRAGIQYSRKKRTKQKAREEALQFQASHLRSANNRLIQENQFLQQTILQAHQIVQHQRNQDHNHYLLPQQPQQQESRQQPQEQEHHHSMRSLSSVLTSNTPPTVAYPVPAPPLQESRLLNANTMNSSSGTGTESAATAATIIPPYLAAAAAASSMASNNKHWLPPLFQDSNLHNFPSAQGLFQPDPYLRRLARTTTATTTTRSSSSDGLSPTNQQHTMNSASLASFLESQQALPTAAFSLSPSGLSEYVRLQQQQHQGPQQNHHQQFQQHQQQLHQQSQRQQHDPPTSNILRSNIARLFDSRNIIDQSEQHNEVTAGTTRRSASRMIGLPRHIQGVNISNSVIEGLLRSTLATTSRSTSDSANVSTLFLQQMQQQQYVTSILALMLAQNEGMSYSTHDDANEDAKQDAKDQKDGTF